MWRRFSPALCAAVLCSCGGAAAATSSAVATPDQRLAGVTLTGQHLSLTQERGHPVVIVFWGAWCGPCHDEQPALDGAYAHWAPHGVVFIGDDMRDDAAAARSFVNQYHVPYPSLSDPDATNAANFEVPAAPAIAFVSSTGHVGDIVFGGLGDMSMSDFNAEVRSLFPSGGCSGC